MNNGKHTPSAAPPTDEAFVRAHANFIRARNALAKARERLDLAQAEQAAAINNLPEPVRADMSQLEAIADQLNIRELGAAALQALQDADTALAVFISAALPSSRFQSEEWDAALADCLAKRAAVLALPQETQTGEDDLVQAVCAAEDHLIEKVAAPNAAALLRKVRMAFTRADGFDFFPEYQDAITADVRRLFPEEAQA